MTLKIYAERSDLVIVAAGKGEIAKMFRRDDERSPIRPAAAGTGAHLCQRHDATGRPLGGLVQPDPRRGEYFVFPALTTTGPCEIMVMEGIPGGPMDCWADVTHPARAPREVQMDRRDLPAVGGRARAELTLTDDAGILAGRFPPTVRQPIGVLPSGAPVLGLADVVVLNDPVTGQGSNNASKCAASYLASILDHGDRPFDAAFMQSTFERYWDYAHYVAGWTNALLAPPSPHVLELLGAGRRPAHRPPLRQRIRRPARLLPLVHGSRIGQRVPRRDARSRARRGIVSWKSPCARIAIVGAGQSGALLALSLLRRNYTVTLVSDRTPTRCGRGR